MDFSVALNELRRGKMAWREDWNGEGMFVYLVPENSYPVQTGVAKHFFGEGTMVPYGAYFAIKTTRGKVFTWFPSTADLLAEDWHTNCC